MAKVFLSYDHDDAALARRIALALEKAGHTVWYDRYIHGGAQYSHKIEQALDSADAVIVLWSPRSIDSAWVRDEAAEGRDRDKLVPLGLEGVTPPIGFRQFQTIDLGCWSGHGRVPGLAQIIEGIENQAGEPNDAPRQGSVAAPLQSLHAPLGNRRAPLVLVYAAVAIVLALTVGAWSWFNDGDLPVVEVTSADSSPRSTAAANDLFVKLGTLAQVGDGKWQLRDSRSASGKADFIFRASERSKSGRSSASLLLLNGKSDSLLWSREFSLPAGTDADLKQQVSLTAGRVLSCVLESRDQGNLPADLLKTFLDACASLADLSGEDYGPVTLQLRKIVDRVPRFEPAWRRLIAAESIAIEYARYTPAEPEMKRQLKSDVDRARALLPSLPELAVADVRLRDRVDYGRDIDRLSAAVERAQGNPFLLAELSNAFLKVGRMEDAINLSRKAAELDPLSVGGTTTYIMTLAHGGQVETARNELAKAERSWAGTGSLHDAQLAFLARYGDPNVAMKLDPEGYATAAYYAARADHSRRNVSLFKARIDEFRPKSVTPAQVGWAIQGLAEFGLVDDVFYWLARLPDDQAAGISYILFRPALASVRRDQRFMLLAKRIGLVDYWQKSRKWPDYCSRPGIPYDCKAEVAKLS